MRRVLPSAAVTLIARAMWNMLSIRMLPRSPEMLSSHGVRARSEQFDTDTVPPRCSIVNPVLRSTPVGPMLAPARTLSTGPSNAMAIDSG